MTLDKKVYLAAAAILAVIIIVLIVLFGVRHSFSQEESTATTTPASATSTPNSGGYAIEQVPLPTLEELEPNLDRAIAFDASVPEAARTSITAQVADIVARLKKDPTNAPDWFNLALLYHTGDDFAAARDVWVFLTKTVSPPGDAVALENLGKLYTFDLKDYVKAESYFKQAIAANPASMDPYMELFQLYRYSYKQNTSAAADILVSAAVKFPDDFTPYYTLGLYYEDAGNTVAARDALQKSMERARAAGDVHAIDLVGNELAKLPS